MTPHPLPGIHGEHSLDDGGCWLVVTRELGHDPANRDGENYRRFDWTVLSRLNHGYGSAGTIPRPIYYEDFSTRVAHYVEMSPGCTRWIIGNEPNHRQEWPEGMPITPDQYAACFKLCRDKIKALPGHEADEVLLAAVAPWNVDTKYPGNESGDWLRYFEDLQRLLGPGGFDGFALHAYVREQTPESVVDNARMSPPFEFAHYGFRVYMDWMAAILPSNQAKPVYITEFNVAGVPWRDANTGVIQAACAEIDGWNRTYPERPISCLATYRWQYDQWAFYDKPGVIEDYMRAVARGYTVPSDGDDGGEESVMQNRSLEQPYIQDGQHSTVKVASGWTYFASNGKPPERDGPCQLPEYKPLNKSQDARRVWDGQTAQCWFIRWKIFDAGIYQVVEAEQGAAYKFDAMAQAWCSDSDDPTVSDGEMYVSLGIDPSGGTNAFSTSVAWSDWLPAGATYKRFYSPEVIAGGTKITVFVRAWNKWELSHNDIYIDDTHLVLVSDPEPPEPPTGCALDWDRLEALMRKVIREELPRWAYVPVELADVTED